MAMAAAPPDYGKPGGLARTGYRQRAAIGVQMLYQRHRGGGDCVCAATSTGCTATGRHVSLLRRLLAPLTGLNGELLRAGVLPCAVAAALLALAGSTWRADALARDFDARGQGLATQLALGLALAEGGASERRLQTWARQRLAQGAAHRIELKLADGRWVGFGSAAAGLPASQVYASADAVRVYADRAALMQARQRIRREGLGAVGSIVLLAWLSQYWLSRRVVRPLRRLGDALGDSHAIGMAIGSRGRHELDVLHHGIAALQRQSQQQHRDAEQRVRASVDEARQQWSQAQAARHGKAQFLAAVGDRLRQPLHALHLFIGVLQRSAVPAQQAAIDRLQQSAHAMGGLLEELLDISRLDAHVIEAQSQPLAVSALFAGPRQALQAQAQARAVAVRWHDGGLWLQGDATLLGRVLQHLLANAIEHAAGGRVLVAARRSGDRVRLEVRDNGIGIARIHQAQIFEEFFQLGGDGPRRERQLGLGLPICARIAALLGTRIELRSELGRGSSFRIELPRAAADAAMAAVAAGVRGG